MYEQPYGPPQQGPPPQYGGPPPSRREYSPPSRSYIGIILVGVIILMVGGIIIASGGFLDTPFEGDYDSDEYEDLYEDEEAYDDTVRLMKAVGNLLEYVGIIILAVGLILGALKDDKLQPEVRQGMLIAMGLIVGFKILSIFLVMGY